MKRLLLLGLALLCGASPAMAIPITPDLAVDGSFSIRRTEEGALGTDSRIELTKKFNEGHFARFRFIDIDGKGVNTEATYVVPVSPQLTATLQYKSLDLSDWVDTMNPHFDGSDLDGSTTEIGTRLSIYNQLPGVGAAIRFTPSRKIEFSGGYFVPFDIQSGDYGALAQVTLKPTPDFKVAANYLRKHHGEASSDTIAGLMSYQVSPGFVVNGNVAHTIAHSMGERGEFTSWTIAAGLPGLFKPNDMLGVVLGSSPFKLELFNGVTAREVNRAIQVEAFYKFPIADNWHLTGAIVYRSSSFIESGTPSSFSGVVRTTYTF